ncbi:hypothetical protein [Paraburkholderia phenoliruptrix]|nr:hypothetical protein [Paraburkholderia phenoliruptrix]
MGAEELQHETQRHAPASTKTRNATHGPDRQADAATVGCPHTRQRTQPMENDPIAAFAAHTGKTA